MHICLHALLALTLLWISWVDFRTKLIPQAGIFILFVIGVFWIFESDQSFWMQISLSFLTSLLFWGQGILITKIKKQPALGLGDVQLWAALTLLLSPSDLPFFMMLAGGFGGIFAAFSQKQKAIPFAPALCLGFAVTFFLKNPPFSLFG
jgi:leader peptidase HopD